MKFNAPTQMFFVISLLLAALAVLSKLTPMRDLTTNSFWVLLTGYVVLAIGCIFKRR